MMPSWFPAAIQKVQKWDCLRQENMIKERRTMVTCDYFYSWIKRDFILSVAIIEILAHISFMGAKKKIPLYGLMLHRAYKP